MRKRSAALDRRSDGERQRSARMLPAAGYLDTERRPQQSSLTMEARGAAFSPTHAGMRVEDAERQTASRDAQFLNDVPRLASQPRSDNM